MLCFNVTPSTFELVMLWQADKIAEETVTVGHSSVVKIACQQQTLSTFHRGGRVGIFKPISKVGGKCATTAVL